MKPRKRTYRKTSNCLHGLISAILFDLLIPFAGAADSNAAQRRESFGQQLFAPHGGFVVQLKAPLPPLVWDNPQVAAKLTDNAVIRTQWFDEDLREVSVARKPGRYFVHGETVGPEGSAFHRALTCVCVAPETNLRSVARAWADAKTNSGASVPVDELLGSWQRTEEGAVQLAAILESNGKAEPRPGQWQMENATRHVRLKRKLMGLATQPPEVVSARPLADKPAPELRRGPLHQTGISASQLAAIEATLDDWHTAAGTPNSVVIAKNGVIVLEKSYGEHENRPMTIHTPMLLHSAMKPLMGIQLAMYVDRGLVDFEQPIGDFLPAFDSPKDRLLTFRAGHAHLTGIHFPWPLAFSRLFYFRTWQESLIAHQPREWQAGTNYRYGVVGIILAVRSLELLSGRNYWDAMEREVFAPLGIRDMLPGGTGFSAENLARIGVLLDNHGKYGQWELFSEETYREIIPQSLEPHFPSVKRVYGVGLQSHASRLGPGSFGHGGGCGTQLTVNPKHHLVFAMVRNQQGPEYKERLGQAMDALRACIE